MRFFLEVEATSALDDLLNTGGWWTRRIRARPAAQQGHLDGTTYDPAGDALDVKMEDLVTLWIEATTTW